MRTLTPQEKEVAQIITRSFMFLMQDNPSLEKIVSLDFKVGVVFEYLNRFKHQGYNAGAIRCKTETFELLAANYSFAEDIISEYQCMIANKDNVMRRTLLDGGLTDELLRIIDEYIFSMEPEEETALEYITNSTYADILDVLLLNTAGIPESLIEKGEILKRYALIREVVQERDIINDYLRNAANWYSPLETLYDLDGE